MKLERFIILTYGFTVCFASIVLFVGTLVFVTIKIDSLRHEADLPAETLETLAATPSESRRVYLDDAGKPVVPPAGFELEPSPAVSKPVGSRAFNRAFPIFGRASSYCAKAKR